jgi:hypothetical protein
LNIVDYDLRWLMVLFFENLGCGRGCWCGLRGIINITYQHSAASTINNIKPYSTIFNYIKLPSTTSKKQVVSNSLSNAKDF